MSRLNPEVKAQWVAALRSGEYTQAAGALRNSKGFCCLGVLCDLHHKAHPDAGEWVPEKDHGLQTYLGATSMPTEEVLAWADCGGFGGFGGFGLLKIPGAQDATLVSHNDRGRTFLEIADAIESQL